MDHGKTGLLVELGDVNGLAAALENLITSPDLRAVMGRAGLEKIKDYALERVLEEMSAIYMHFLGKDFRVRCD